MIRAGGRSWGGDDRGLAATFISNAESFLKSAEQASGLFPEHSLYFVAIAVELSLKAYLLHRGFSDDWNRVHLRHDLTKALSCAQRAGFGPAPRDIAELARRLTPLYSVHAFGKISLQDTPSAALKHACITTAKLIAKIKVAIDKAAEPKGPLHQGIQ